MTRGETKVRAYVFLPEKYVSCQKLSKTLPWVSQNLALARPAPVPTKLYTCTFTIAAVPEILKFER